MYKAALLILTCLSTTASAQKILPLERLKGTWFLMSIEKDSTGKLTNYYGNWRIHDVNLAKKKIRLTEAFKDFFTGVEIRKATEKTVSFVVEGTTMVANLRGKTNPVKLAIKLENFAENDELEIVMLEKLPKSNTTTSVGRMVKLDSDISAYKPKRPEGEVEVIVQPPPPPAPK